MQSSVLRQKVVGQTNVVYGAEDLVHEDGIQIVHCVVFFKFFCIVFYSATMILFFFYHLLEIRLI